MSYILYTYGIYSSFYNSLLTEKTQIFSMYSCRFYGPSALYPFILIFNFYNNTQYSLL